MKQKLSILSLVGISSVMVSCYPPSKKPDSLATPPLNNEAVTNANANLDIDESHRQSMEEFQHQNGTGTEDQTIILPENPTSTLPKIGTNPTLPHNKVVTPTVTQTIPTPPSTLTPPKSYPYARAVSGKSGFVYNPYTQKQIDVRGFSSGTLVSDPGDATQKFYVP